MIDLNDIEIVEIDKCPFTEFQAKLVITSYIKTDIEELRHKDTIEVIKDNLKRSIIRKIYGEIAQEIRAALYETKTLLITPEQYYAIQEKWLAVLNKLDNIN